MGNGESSPKSDGRQSSFSARGYTEKSDFNKEHARAAFIPDNFTSLDQHQHMINMSSAFTLINSCHGFEEVLARYRKIVPFIMLSGPTSFAPLIYASIDIVERSNWQYHVLVIIADGQVTRSSDTPHGSFSPQELTIIDAIVAASYYPLSIVMIGVGDGPWDVMQQFDDCIPQRSFDSFQKQGDKQGSSPALPPPREVIKHDNRKPINHAAPSFCSTAYNAPSLRSAPTDVSTSSITYTTPTEQACPICLTNPKDMAFGCGHLTSKDCGATLSACPLCRAPISTRLRLYS